MQPLGDFFYNFSLKSSEFSFLDHWCLPTRCCCLIIAMFPQGRMILLDSMVGFEVILLTVRFHEAKPTVEQPKNHLILAFKTISEGF